MYDSTFIRMEWMGGSLRRHMLIAGKALQEHPGDSVDAEIDRLAYMASIAGFVHGDFMHTLAMRVSGDKAIIARALARIAGSISGDTA